MNARTLKAISIAGLVVALIALGLTINRSRDFQIGTQGITHYSGLGVDMDVSGTATPAVEINQDGSGAILRVKDGGTPVFEVYNGGNTAFTGDMTLTGDLAPAGALAITVPTAEATAVSGLDVVQNGVGEIAEFNDGSTEIMAIRNGGGVVVTGPTAVATAQPAFVVDSAGVSKVFSFRDGGSEIIGGRNGGQVDLAGSLVQAVPTAQATASPGMIIDSSAVANSFEVRAGATPQVSIRQAGDLDFDAGQVVLDSDVFDLNDTYIDQDQDTENIMLPTVLSTNITYTPATGTIATIGDGEVWLVHGVIVNVTTNFDCTGDNCALTIGDDTDADGFIVLADGELQTADTEGTGFPAGWQGLIPATQGVFIDAAAGSTYFVYAPSGAAQTIDFAVAGTDPAAGAATVYVVYTRIQ